MNFVIKISNFSEALNLLTNEEIYLSPYGCNGVLYPVSPEI